VIEDNWACYCCEMCQETEQERIIKLLDESLIYDEPVVIQRDQLIELIKEKNK